MYIKVSRNAITTCLENCWVICPITKAVARRASETTCAMALFVNNTTQQEALCILKTIERGRAVVVHLGGRRWAFISDRHQSVTINCPLDSTLPSTVSLPKRGMLEIPLSCSAHTESWVLPATIHKEKKETQDRQPLDQIALKEMDRGYEERYTTLPTRTSIRSLSVQ